MKKKIAILALVVMMFSLFAGTSNAAATAKVTRIYGTETKAFGCHGFTEFYASKMFIWVQLDIDVSAATGFQKLNQQVLGDSTIKSSANDKIKLGGMTVKQLNAAAGNPYTAMIAYEENGQGKLRMSIWLSWGGSSIQDLFKKEVHPDITLEILAGMQVPANGYTASNLVYAELTPVKYQLSIADLEFVSDPTAPGYDASKKDWVKPMFENLAAQWTLATGATTTPTKPATSSTVTSVSTSTKTSSQVASTSASTSGTTSESTLVSVDGISSAIADSSEDASSTSGSTITSSKSDTGEDGSSAPVLPIILGVVGILVLGGGVGYFIYLKKKGA